MPHAMTDTGTDTQFAAFLQRHRGALLKFLRRLNARDAEDLLQETVAKVWRYRGSWDPAQTGSGWLFQAAFRILVDHRRRAARRPRANDELARSQSTAPPCAVELRDELERSLLGLSEVERALLLGFHRDQLSLQELAAAYGLPVNTVKSHLHRARRRLQQENADAM